MRLNQPSYITFKDIDSSVPSNEQYKVITAQSSMLDIGLNDIWRQKTDRSKRHMNQVHQKKPKLALQAS